LDILLSLIPLIPAMIEAGKPVWNDLIKPLLIGKCYKYSSELEQEMIMLEEQKNVNAIIEKLKELNNELNQIHSTQIASGDNNTQVGVNTRDINNSNIHISINEKSNVNEKQDIVKKN